MRRWFVAATVVFQVGVLAVMAGEREWILRTGKTVILRTAPIDPRDPFRGDYVSLNYEISRIPRKFWKDGLVAAVLADYGRGRERRIYVGLTESADVPAEITFASDRRPPGGLFIRGKRGYVGQGVLRARFGIESYYVKEGTGGELEGRRREDGVQVPLEMVTALGPDGTAVLKHHRWGCLGIGLDTEFTGAGATRRITAVSVVLKNVSDAPLAVVDLPWGRSLRLVPAVFGWESEDDRTDMVWVNREAARPAPTAAAIRVLAPGEKRSIRVELDDPFWYVKEKGKPAKPITALEGWRQFRLVYEPPSAKELAGLPNANLVWHGRLPSPAF